MAEERATYRERPNNMQGGRPMGGPMGGGPRHMAGLMGPKAKAKDTRKTLGRLWSYLRKQSRQLLIVFMLVLASSVLGLTGPYLIGRGIDAMASGPEGVNFGRLGLVIAAMLSAYSLSSLMIWFQTYVMAGVAQRTVRELRKDLFAKLQTLSLRFFDGRSHGELMSRLTNDVENINHILNQSTTQVFSSVITVTGALGMMLWLNPIMAVLSLVSVPLGIILTTRIAAHTRKYFSEQQKELGELNGNIEEIITGQRVVKAFTREKKAEEKFSAINTRLKNASTRAQIFSGVIPPMMGVINNLSFALVAAAGGWMAIQGMMTVGLIASFLDYTKQFSRPINEIANQFNMIQSALAGAERIFEIMDEAPEFADDSDAELLQQVSGHVAFQKVTFGYKSDVPVLKNVNLTAKPGQTIALVGPTGAGKTTIVNLLTRFYDIDSGCILVDGKDIRNLEKNSLRRSLGIVLQDTYLLRRSLGIVLQDTYLFADTVRENIRYGRLDATDAEVEAAARLANAEPFILRLHDGYDTILSEEGSNLSQGQRQLLTIARAILANPSILILDEATSSVDTRTEMHIQEAMLSLMKGRTSFVIAHRLSTIREADQILVIHGGEIIERGTHEELLDAKGFYHELYASQFRKQAS